MAEPPRSLYFVNAWVDGAVMGLGSLVLLAGVAATCRTDEVPPGVLEAVAVGLWALKFPHLSATLQRLYGSPRRAAGYPTTSVGLGVAVLFLAVVALLAPDRALAPAAQLVLVWTPYHFASQSTGLALVYLRRAQVELSLLERRALDAFTLLASTAGAARTQTGHEPMVYFDVTVLPLGLPPWVRAVSSAGTVLAALALAGLFFRRTARGERAVPWIALAPLAATLAWYGPGPARPAFLILTPLFHEAQYLLVTWAAVLKERAASGEAPSVALATLRFAATNLLGGAALGLGLPTVVGHASGASPSIARAAAIIFVQIHHGALDGVIWKLRDPPVMASLEGSLADYRGLRLGAPRAPAQDLSDPTTV